MSNSKTVELKPCPFCGGRNLDSTCQDREETGARRGFYFVYCNLCEACGPTDFDHEGAIEEWNIRAMFGDETI